MCYMILNLFGILFFLQLQHTPQHLIRILQIIVDVGSDLSVRQSASIHFKNFIAKHWEPHSGICLYYSWLID